MAHPEDLHSKQRRRNLRTASPQGATMIGLLIGAAALGGGFVTTRNFVRRRLRFVDAAQKPAVPLLVGLAATAVALPIALLPVVTVGTAVAFGVGVAGGFAAGREKGAGGRYTARSSCRSPLASGR